MHRITVPADDDLQLEVDLGGKVQVDNAAQLMLLYTEGARGTTLEQAYEKFREALSMRWKQEISSSTTYLIVEAIFEIVREAKKKHIELANSKFSESALAANLTET